MMEKASLFIDGGYLNRILKDHFKEFRLEFSKFSDTICTNLMVSRLRTYYYHCLPVKRKNLDKDSSKIQGMQRFISNLKRLPRFDVKLGKLQLIGNQFKQKMVDVLMSLDIADMCFDGQIQHAILVAGDSDFIPAIKKAKDYGAITHLFYHPSSVHTEMLDEMDELHILDTKLLQSCALS